MLVRRQFIQLLLLTSVAAFSVGTAGKATLAQPLARSATPVCQFGTGNFDDSLTTGFKFSPIPGESKVSLRPLRHTTVSISICTCRCATSLIVQAARERVSRLLASRGLGLASLQPAALLKTRACILAFALGRVCPQTFKGSKLGDDYSNALPAQLLALGTAATPLLFLAFLVKFV